ncbi:MAG: ArsR/SmtB family transcription factor [bacterium]
MADLFKALGHPTRLKILRLLCQGEICVCEMAPQLEHFLHRRRHLSCSVCGGSAEVFWPPN